jgi:Protein of unknown function (DUF3606)
MSDRPEPSGTDPEDISIASYATIVAWCDALACTELQLAEAIGVVGYSVLRVRDFLARDGDGSKPPTNC